ncbi:hypothetical protein A8713_08195 [Streptomyces sp. SAT1]|uniref:hypothetical protein n=1 Tax=Streptomyces sp. SAT1 TaxID=1849967 RepID=UPI0007DDFFCE|nr:hypothetical protein [Streptomyces sp. SAT1]ANH91162.1 hypothetical protein A8713_08195 [Streptomyces sp. SAT1]
MTNEEIHAVPVRTAPGGDPGGDLDGDLASLRGDGARMAPRWSAPARRTGAAPAAAVSAARIHGVSVPDTSARLLEGMSEYGD